MTTFLDRYQAGDHVAVWDDLMALGEGVRHELYYADAAAVAAETMRRARHNVELLIRRLDARGYRFQDAVASAEDEAARLGVIGQISAQVEARVAQNPSHFNSHCMEMVDWMRAVKAKTAPLMEKAAADAAKAAAARRKPPLEDPQVFSPPDKKTPRLLDRIEKAAGGPLPLSLRAWYEQVGGVSLMGSDAVVNAVDFSNRGVVQQLESLYQGQRPPVPQGAGDYAPDPLVVFPLQALMQELSYREEDGEQAGEGRQLRLTIAPDDLHKANVSGDAYYITLPDARADFQFDDWRHTTFVNYLRIAFQWGGFPGWERSPKPPRKEIAELSEGLLPL